MKIKLTIFVVMLILFALTGCFFSSEPQLPTSGPSVYLLNEGDLPDRARLLEYQEVPHSEGTDYAVSFEMSNDLQVYSKICYKMYSPRLPDLSLQWPDTVRVDAPTVGQESMTFHGPVIDKPSVTVTFIQGQWEGMIQVIGSDDSAATELAINFARAVAARLPLTASPTSSAAEQAECYKTIELSVSNVEFGPPVTTYHTSDAIFPMVSNPIDCGPATVRLVDSNGKIVMEQSFSVAGGTTGYGDYNEAGDLAAGGYKMELWYGDILLKTIHLTVR